MELSKHLKRRFIIAFLATVGVFLLLVGTTFAWYVYNTSSHTTSVNMAVGSGANLNISNAPDGTFGYSALLESFVGILDPVSTDKITNGFQKVTKFEDTNGTVNGIFATVFGPVEASDYYKTSLYLKTNGKKMDVYVSEIGFEDSNETCPISTAIRVGLVVHKVGENQPTAGEYIFEISDLKNPQAHYNTMHGESGNVLDSTRKDGFTIPFKPYSSANFCQYDKETGKVTLYPESLAIATVEGTADANYGESVQVDVYIWLEGCDEDCFTNLQGETLKNISISFAGNVTEN